MKKLFIFITLVIPSVAFAMLGDSKTQAVQRYGKPFLTYGNTLYYHTSKFIVAQWYNENGRCELVGYFKLSGGITDEEHAKIGRANLAGTGLAATDWIEQQSINPNTRFWISYNGLFAYEAGLAALAGSKYMYSGESIATVSGLAKYNAEQEQLHAKNGDQQFTDDARKTDI